MFGIQVDEHIELQLLSNLHSKQQTALVASNRAYIGTWLPWAWASTELAHSQQFVRIMRQSLAAGQGYGFAILYDGSLAGGIGLHQRNKVAHTAEIGYWLGQPFTGKGIMTRAVKAVTDFSYRTLGMNRIFIRAATENIPSQNVAKRAGYQYEMTGRQSGYISDQDDNRTIIDLQYYSMLRDEWTPFLEDAAIKWPVDTEFELRLFERHHTAALYDLVDQNRDHLRQWLPWVDDTQSTQDTAAFIERTLNNYAQENGFAAGIWYKGDLVGAVEYHYWDFNQKKTEIGYWLSQHVTGSGIMTRVVHCLTQFALVNLGLNRVEIMCAVGNEKSAAIPQRLGYTLEGVQRQATLARHTHLDARIYAMLAQDWSIAGAKT